MAGSGYRNRLGERGEAIAADYLQEQGYQIKERNFRCKSGEIDMIATIHEYLVFVEVKSRSQTEPAIHPFISLTKYKCNKIRHLAKIYLSLNEIRDWQPRFDVIGIVFHRDDSYTLEHIVNAF